MSGTKALDLRTGAIVSIVFLLQPIVMIFLLTLIAAFIPLIAGFTPLKVGLIPLAFVNLSFAKTLIAIPGMLIFMFDFFGNMIAVSAMLFATYFGVRAAAAGCFGRSEAVLIAILVPLAAIVTVDLYHSPLRSLYVAIKGLASVEIFVALLVSVACTLVFHYALIRNGFLCRREAAS